ncbi:MAG: TonB-dependent receptor [Pseudomonadota bacterium]|nr:TonB-dependent receptor [Pseudomonadota bacterium]
MKSRLKPLVALLAACPLYGLAAEIPMLDEIVVSAVRANHQPVSAFRLGEAELSPLRPATSDTASLLRDIPGVSLYGAGGVSSLPVIHGLGDDRLRTKVDGMDLISACGNHMNPPLSYIDPTRVGSIQVFAGIAPVSVGGDSIGGAIVVASSAPEFAKPGQGKLLKGEAGAFYRSNGNGRGGNLSATIANEQLSMTYSASTAKGDDYTAGGNFKPAGWAYINDGRSITQSTKWLSGDEVGSTLYDTRNQSLAFALRHENHLVEMKYGVQDIPYQGFPNQRMDMTANDGEHLNLSYTGQYDWGKLQARAYHEHTQHKMNFLEDKAYWYQTGAPGMPMDTEGKNTGLTIKAEIVLSERDLLRAGGEFQQYRFSDWWPPSGTGGMSPLTFLDINDGERDRYAVFGEWEARWTPQWMTQFGVRHETVKMDTGQVQGYKTGDTTYAADAAAFNAADRGKTDQNWDMTALARYTVDRQKDFEFGYAQKTRSPNLYERYAWSTGGMAMNMINMVGDGNGYVGNLDLKPEVAHTLSATFNWHGAEQKNWGLKLTPYYTYVQDYINARRCAAADTKATTSTFCNTANVTAVDTFVFLKYANQDANLYGFDVSGYFPLASNTGFGSFTMSGMLNYVRGKTADGTSDNLYNIMPLNAKLAVEQQFGNWSNTVEAVFVDDKTDVSAIRNEIKTPSYALLNLRSSYTWKRARFDVGIDNLFDKLYYHPLSGAYVGQGTTMPPTASAGSPLWGIAVPGMGRSIYAGLNVKF